MENKKTCGICYEEKTNEDFVKNFCKCKENVCKRCFVLIKKSTNNNKYLCPYCRSKDLKDILRPQINCKLCYNLFESIQFFNNEENNYSDYIFVRCKDCRYSEKMCNCGQKIFMYLKHDDFEQKIFSASYHMCYTCWFKKNIYERLLKMRSEIKNDTKEQLEKYMEIYKLLPKIEKLKLFNI